MKLPKIFIINLKSSVDRKKHMERVLSELPMEFEFVEAIDARELKNESITPDIIDYNSCTKNVGAALSKAQLCCALSHIKTWRLIQEQNLEDAFIMEDDIIIKDKNAFIEILRKRNQFPKDWELVLFAHGHTRNGQGCSEVSFLHRKKIYQRYTIIRFIEMGIGALGYFINIQGIYKLLDNSLPLSSPIDYYTGNDRIVNLYGINPVIIEEDEYFGNKSDRQLLPLSQEEEKSYYQHLEKHKRSNIEYYNNNNLIDKQSNLSLVDFIISFLQFFQLWKFFRYFMNFKFFRKLIRSFILEKYKRRQEQ